MSKTLTCANIAPYASDYKSEAKKSDSLKILSSIFIKKQNISSQVKLNHSHSRTIL